MTFLMGNKLRDMIRSIRTCKTAAEERAVIAKECAALRDLLKEPTQYHRHRNVAKLMFIHMLGYPTHFGQMECIKLIAEGDFPEKRIGYLGLMVLLDERQEVLMLVTNSIKNDLYHTNQHVVGLALCALGNICTAVMARELSVEVERLLHDKNAYIRKKAALCAVRIVRKVPDLVESYKGPALNLLMDKHHGVLVAGVKLCIELCLASDAALELFRKQVSTIVRLLKSLVLGGYVPEYDVTGISDPLLQIKLLKLLRLVGKGDSDSSDIMSDVLAQVATNTEGTKNAGRAILYECVLTIMAIEDIGGLRILAINILGRFLANIDNNIRYVALNTLVKVVAVDNQAVQRHRAVIVNCVKDSDVSIRARALELVVSLVNESNVKVLIAELLEYLKVSDPEFKVDLAAKTAALVQKFAPTKLWYIDQIILIMVEAGIYVKEEVLRSLVVVVSNAIDLQGYAVRALYRAFRSWSGQETLAQVTVWCIGEYGDMLVNNSNELEGEDPQTVTESDAVDVVETVLRDPRVSPNTIAFCLTALLKMASRFPQCTKRIQALLEEYSRHTILELQQRSTEFGSILSRHSNLRGPLLERIPVLDLASYSSKHAGIDSKFECRSVSPVDRTFTPDPTSTELTTNHLMDMLTIEPEDHLSALSASAGDELLNIIGGNSRPKSASWSTPVRYSVGGASALLDILAVEEPTESSSVSASSTVSRRPSALEELLSNPLPDHRLSILELEPQCPHGTPLDEDISLTSNRTSLVGSIIPAQRSGALAFDEMLLTSSRASVVGSEPTTSQQRVYPEPTLAQQKRISLNDARLQRRQGSYTEPSIPQQRRSFLRGEALKSSDIPVDDTWPSQAQQRKIKEDSALRISRLSFQSETTPAQLRMDELPQEGGRVSVQSKGSGVPVVDIWPTAAQQREIQEDSALRISRLSFHADPTPAQLPIDEFPQSSSRVSVHMNQSKGSGVPVVNIWPTAAQQREIQEDSALRISRLSFHADPTRAQLPIDEFPQSSSRVSVHMNQSKGSGVPVVNIWPTAAQQREIQEDSALRINRLSFHPEPTPAQMRRSDEFLPASSRIPIPSNQSKVLPEKRISHDVPLNAPPIVALQTQGLKVDFEFTKTLESPQTTVIKALFSNMSTTPYTDFIFQAAVPKYMTLKLDPASSSVLSQNSNGKVSQVLTVTNSLHGQKPLIMRLRISYKVDGQPVLEQGQVNHFPPNL